MAKKFVRYKEGSDLYSIGMTKFQALAKEAGAVCKIDGMALANCKVFEKFLETFLSTFMVPMVLTMLNLNRRTRIIKLF